MTNRFSKKSLAAYIQTRIGHLQQDWGFDPDNGTAQIPHIAADRLKTNPIDQGEFPNKDEIQYTLDSCHKAYATFIELCELAAHFELDILVVPSNFRISRTHLSRIVRYRPQKEEQ